MTKATIAACFAVLSASAAQAAELSFWQKLELKEACSKDVETLCSGVEPGEGRLAQCFRDNEAKLSTGCKETIATLRADLLDVGAPMDF